MLQFKKLLLPMAVMSMVASCTNEEITPDASGELSSNGITMAVEDFEIISPQTRAAVAFGYPVTIWEGDETVGIYDEKGNYTSRSFNSTDPFLCGSATTTVDGSSMNTSRKYAACYPYQKLDSDGYYPIDLSHLYMDPTNSGSYSNFKWNYMYAPSINIGSNGKLNFSFRRKYGLLCFYLTNVPSGSYVSSVTVKNADNDYVFVTKAVMDLADGEVYPDEEEQSVSMEYTHAQYPNSSGTISTVIPVLPTYTGDLICTINMGGNRYTTKLNAIDIDENQCYVWSIDLGNLIELGKSVDFGLPSGTRWAKCNLGTTLAYNYGTYYAWGEVKGCIRRTTTGNEVTPAIMDGYPSNWTGGKSPNYIKGQRKSTYTWDNYKWSKYEGLAYKYNTDNEALEDADNAVKKTLGANWDMPTIDQIEELGKYCYFVWTDNYLNSKVGGYIVYKAKNTSDRGKVIKKGKEADSSYKTTMDHIFLPAAGCRTYESFQDGDCMYWGKNLKKANVQFPTSLTAAIIELRSNPSYEIKEICDWYYRYAALPIRPVYIKK